MAHVDPPHSFRVRRTQKQSASLPCRNINTSPSATVNANTHKARKQREAIWRFWISRYIGSDLQTNKNSDESVARTIINPQKIEGIQWQSLLACVAGEASGRAPLAAFPTGRIARAGLAPPQPQFRVKSGAGL